MPQQDELAPRTARRLAGALERWFKDAQRDLPWRAPVRSLRERGYRALVAEAMLQQTQVVRVAERFVRFIERFPSVETLAQADEQEVLAEWQGLGYYRRARNLHAAARMIVKEYGGAVPREVDELRTLPGVGPYTAGAIASIAYGVRTPLVDGNVQRVAARLIAIDASLDSPELRRASWSLAGSIVEVTEAPGVLNQALMELGSTVCTPRSPKCGRCPVASWCRARQAGVVDSIPRPKSRTPKESVHAASVVVHRRGRIVLARRPSSGLWSNMWEAPGLEQEEPAGAPEVRRLLESKYGLQEASLQERGDFVHHTSHRTLIFSVWSAESPRGRLRFGEWVAASSLSSYPISNAHRRALQIGLGPLAKRFLTASG